MTKKDSLVSEKEGIVSKGVKLSGCKKYYE